MENLLRYRPLPSRPPSHRCAIYNPFLFAPYLPPAFLSAMMTPDSSLFLAVSSHYSRRHRNQPDFEVPQLPVQEFSPFDPIQNEYAIGVRCC
jgi:hypothetical protein